MAEDPRDSGSGSGKYRTLFELGEGGTANVFLAMGTGTEGTKKLFVVKQLRRVYAQDPEFRAMFMTEAQLSVRLSHPHVVRVHEVSEQGELPTISMEYIEGQTLDAVLGPGEPRLPLELHLRVLADVLSGLHYAHELLDAEQAPLNVVHRDVSPHNVMISYEGVVKVLDFGIAKLSGSTVETDTGIIKGKLRYMPPEQVAGEAVDRRADVFAVGVMLWDALSGAKLWQGLSDAMILNRLLSGRIPAPENPDGPIPPELLAICARALAPQREQRYQTALELEQALEDYLSAHSQDVTAGELGRYMCDRFASLRRAVQERIEGELRLRKSSGPGGARSARPRNRTPSRTGYSTTRRERAAPPRSKVWMVAVASMALGVLIIVWGVRERRAPTLSAMATPATSRVSVTIEARPESASISIDGDAVSNPYVAERVVDGRPHRVRLSAPGYATEETEVTFDADVRLARVLSALPPTAPSSPPAASSASKSQPAARAPSVPSPAASASAPAPSASALLPEPSCDPPYFFDALGIKKFKPECL